MCIRDRLKIAKAQQEEARLAFQQALLNAVATVFVYRYPCVGEFIFNLIRLVTYLAYIALVIGQYIALSLIHI